MRQNDRKLMRRIQAAAAEEIRGMLKDWMEMQRNEMIVGLLDDETGGAESD